MSTQPKTPDDFVWYPTPDDIENAHLTKFIRHHEITDLDELMSRSTRDIAWLTEAILEYLKIEFYEPYRRSSIFPRAMPGRSGWVGAR